MGDMMVRKQIYIPKKQNQALKRLARQRGISESEVIRMALTRETEMPILTVRDSKKAMDEIFAFVETLRKRPEFMKGEPVKFNREELYEERENRWFNTKEGE